MTSDEIINGDVYDIEQTINGISTFLWFNNTWYYFTTRLSCKYEYDKKELTKVVLNEFGVEDVKLIKNIFE